MHLNHIKCGQQLVRERNSSTFIDLWPTVQASIHFYRGVDEIHQIPLLQSRTTCVHTTCVTRVYMCSFSKSIFLGPRKAFPIKIIGESEKRGVSRCLLQVIFQNICFYNKIFSMVLFALVFFWTCWVGASSRGQRPFWLFSLGQTWTCPPNSLGSPPANRIKNY